MKMVGKHIGLKESGTGDRSLPAFSITVASVLCSVLFYQQQQQKTLKNTHTKTAVNVSFLFGHRLEQTTLTVLDSLQLPPLFL